MRRICVVVCILFVVLVAYLAGYAAGKDHVIYAQELYSDGEYICAEIDGDIHEYIPYTEVK